MLDRRVEITKTLRATRWCCARWSVGWMAAGCGAGRRRGSGPSSRSSPHLADTEERALGRVRRMLAEDHPQLEPFDQEALAIQRHYLDLDVKGELARLEQLRGEHLALLDGLDRSGWERTGQHGQHGLMSVELYETHVAAEEVDHLAQIARLL
jgi:hypothetical protein